MTNIVVEGGEFLKTLIFPDVRLTGGLFLLMIIDLITGIQKSNHLGVATRSEGLKKTLKKTTTYLNLISLFWIVSNMAILSSEDAHTYSVFSMLGIMSFLVHLEVKSILENLILLQEDNTEMRRTLVIIHNAWIMKRKNFTEFSYVETKEMLEQKLTK